MEMKAISSGRLRAIGYDAATRTLRVRLDDGTTLEYVGVGQEIWRRLSTAGSAWSIYRDNVEEEFEARRVTTADSADGPKKNPLDDLFG
ncbi:MAG TPA: KTSC domain-containing protein [Rhodocyclaceae bacterium]|nr:KTSC domain-containing protein [Rhodocyclaceae bacterium]